MSYIPRLKKEYKEYISKTLMDNHGLANVMQVPKLKKIADKFKDNYKMIGDNNLCVLILHYHSPRLLFLYLNSLFQLRLRPRLRAFELRPLFTPLVLIGVLLNYPLVDWFMQRKIHSSILLEYRSHLFLSLIHI